MLLFSHFTSEETKVQGNFANRWQSQVSNLGDWTLESMLSPLCYTAPQINYQ